MLKTDRRFPDPLSAETGAANLIIEEPPAKDEATTSTGAPPAEASGSLSPSSNKASELVSTLSMASAPRRPSGDRRHALVAANKTEEPTRSKGASLADGASNPEAFRARSTRQKPSLLVPREAASVKKANRMKTRVDKSDGHDKTNIIRHCERRESAPWRYKDEDEEDEGDELSMGLTSTTVTGQKFSPSLLDLVSGSSDEDYNDNLLGSNTSSAVSGSDFLKRKVSFVDKGEKSEHKSKKKQKKATF